MKRRASDCLFFKLFIFAAAVVWMAGCQPKAVQELLGPSHALGFVLADEAVRLAGPGKPVALITHDTSWGPPSTAEEALKAALKKRGVAVQTVKAANPGNPMLSGEVGLKSADFFEALDKSGGAGAVISLVGAPLLKDGDMGRVKPGHPPVLVVATASLGDKMGVRSDPVELARLLEANVIQLAIIDGGEPSAGDAGKSDANRELFAQNYRVLKRPK